MSADCYIARVWKNTYCGARNLGGNAVAHVIRGYCKSNKISEVSDPNEPGFEVYLVDPIHARKIFELICSEASYSDRVADDEFEDFIDHPGQLQFVIES